MKSGCGAPLGLAIAANDGARMTRPIDEHGIEARQIRGVGHESTGAAGPAQIPRIGADALPLHEAVADRDVAAACEAVEARSGHPQQPEEAPSEVVFERAVRGDLDDAPEQQVVAVAVFESRLCTRVD